MLSSSCQKALRSGSHPERHPDRFFGIHLSMYCVAQHTLSPGETAVSPPKGWHITGDGGKEDFRLDITSTRRAPYAHPSSNSSTTGDSPPALRPSPRSPSGPRSSTTASAATAPSAISRLSPLLGRAINHGALRINFDRPRLTGHLIGGFDPICDFQQHQNSDSSAESGAEPSARDLTRRPHAR